MGGCTAAHRKRCAVCLLIRRARIFGQTIWSLCCKGSQVIQGRSVYEVTPFNGERFSLACYPMSNVLEIRLPGRAWGRPGKKVVRFLLAIPRYPESFEPALEVLRARAEWTAISREDWCASKNKKLPCDHAKPWTYLDIHAAVCEDSAVDFCDKYHLENA